MKKQQVIIRIALILGIIVAVNLIGYRAYFRLDFTEDSRYTLSDITEDLMSELAEPVTVRAYFTEEMLPENELIRNDLEDLLKEYQNLSGGNLVYEFVNPNVSDSMERIVLYEKGMTPTIEQVRERDKFVERRVYMGAEISISERTGRVSNFSSETSMEYALTREIRRLIQPEKPKIGFILGHGEPATDKMFQLKAQLNILYDVREIEMSDTTVLTPDYRAIAIVNPKDTFPPSHLNALDGYLKAGGNLFVGMFNVYTESEPEFGQQMDVRPSIGLREWLSAKGIIIGNDYVYDKNMGNVTIPVQTAMGAMYTEVPFPFAPIIDRFPKHVITTGLEQMYIPIISSISIDQNKNFKVDTLLQSSNNSGVLLTPQPLPFDGQSFRAPPFDRSKIPLAMAITGDVSGSGNTNRIVVIANGRIWINPRPDITNPQGLVRPPDNVNFPGNAIDWLADETGLINLRTKAITSRPIKELEDGERNFYKYLNVGLPIILILLIGLVRFQYNKRRRSRWQES